MWQRTLQRALVAVLCLMAIASAAGVDAGSTVAPWERWHAHDPDSTLEVDHTAWELFLTRHIRIGSDGIYRVAYGRVTPPDRKALDDYLAELSRIPISQYDRTEERSGPGI
jgi:hypothetical protein